jgi:hypothetical protein
MDATAWPEQDRDWIARYRRSTTGRHVPVDALGERERELLDAVLGAGLPAEELFGAADALAAEDVAELATADEAVRTSEGGGLQPALREVGGTLVGLGAVSSFGLWFRTGWSVDVDVASAVLAASVAALFLGWAVARATFSAGRPAATVGVLLAAAAAAAAGMAAAVQVGSGPLAARDAPVPVLVLVLLAPGVLTLLVASRLSRPTLREDWDDAEWLRRFEGGLRTRLVPSATTRAHVEQVRQEVRTGTASAVEEFGHPLVLARHLADIDRTARARRWWTSTVAGTAAPLAIAVLVRLSDSWGALTTPLVLLLLLGALLAPLGRWSTRPWAAPR